MISFPSVALFALAYVSCLVNASPLVGRGTLDVAAPPVTYPTKGAVWKAGEKQTVTWDTSNLPTQITNPTGKVVLGWLEGKGFNLQLDAPLAEGFLITAGKVDIIVPSQYPDRDTYIIALMGSSDNISPTFTITGGSSGPGTDDLPPSSTSGLPTSVPDAPPPTTSSSSSSVVHDAPSPSPSPSLPPSSISSLPPSSVQTSSSSPSGPPQSSNGNISSSNSAWVNKPANVMVVSLLAASLIALF